MVYTHMCVIFGECVVNIDSIKTAAEAFKKA